MNIRGKELAAAAFLIVGVFVSWSALNRALPNASPKDKPHLVQDVSPLFEKDHPYYISSKEMEFEVQPSEDNLEAVTREAADKVERVANQQLSRARSLSEDRLSALARIFERHFQVVLSGSYDRWLAFIASLDVSFDGDPGEEGGPPTKEYFKLNATAYKMAPFSTNSIRIRALYHNGTKLKYKKSPTTLKAMVRGPYDPPENPSRYNVDVYEIIIQMQMRSGSDGDSDNMNVGFAYYWSGERSRWMPYQIFSYNDRGGRLLMYAY